MGWGFFPAGKKQEIPNERFAHHFGGFLGWTFSSTSKNFEIHSAGEKWQVLECTNNDKGNLLGNTRIHIYIYKYVIFVWEHKYQGLWRINLGDMLDNQNFGKNIHCSDFLDYPEPSGIVPSEQPPPPRKKLTSTPNHNPGVGVTNPSLFPRNDEIHELRVLIIQQTPV